MQCDHFPKNIFPGCSQNRSQIWIIFILKSNFSRNLRPFEVNISEIHKKKKKKTPIKLKQFVFFFFFLNSVLWKIILGFQVICNFSGPARKFPKIPGTWNMKNKQFPQSCAYP